MIWLLLILLAHADGQPNVRWTGTQSLSICADNEDIRAYFKFSVQPQNQYTLNITTEIQPFSRMILRFDSEVSLKLIEPTDARISKFPGPSQRSNQFIVMFTDKNSLLRIQVFGPATGLFIPYVLSVILNDVELCTEPKIGYFDDKIKYNGNINEDFKLFEGRAAKTPFLDESCGRLKVAHTELIVHGESTQPGDWPWHVAIKRVKGLSFSYICGGTLMSKTLVLTAAHCATTTEGNPVIPNYLIIELGKYNLHGGDIGRQEMSVGEVIIHPEFDVKTLNNDIALLKFDVEAVFDDYVQPACFWNTAVPTEEVFGTVVGWGFDHHDKLSLTLQQITIPIVSELTCLKSDPIFFQSKLNTNKFCGGFANGTSVCNGDSGGGLMIFVPDTAGDTDRASGSWYVRGIVSFARKRSGVDNVCDPHQYTIFTDVEKYLDWMIQYL